jgi:hypothetical protein
MGEGRSSPPLRSGVNIVDLGPKDGTSPTCIYVFISASLLDLMDGKDEGWDHAIQ